MSAEPIWIDCEGTGCPPASQHYPICAMCGVFFSTVAGVVVPHQRTDILAMIERGDFG